MPANVESSMQEDIEEEEVWLYWIDSNKEPYGKSIRHLAQDAKSNHKKDVENITYYRLGHLRCIFPVLFVLISNEMYMKSIVCTSPLQVSAEPFC